MEFQMSDMPISDPKVGAVIARCLQTCGGAIDEALIQSKDLIPEADWKVLRRGFGQILGSDMHDLWTALVKHHPQYGSGFPSPGEGSQAR